MSGKWFLYGFICTSLTVSTAYSAVLLSDDFNYPDGPLVSVAEGRWKTHSGTAGQVEVVSGEIKLTQKKSEDVSAAVQGAPLGPDQAPALYASFKFKFLTLPTGINGGYFAHFKDLRPTTGLRGRIFATTNGASLGAFRLGIAAGTNAPTALLPKELRLNTPYRAVCRMMLANHRSTLWLNPSVETDPNVTATDEAAAKTVSAFAFRQSVASGSGMGELTVDSVVVSTTFAETRLALQPMILTDPQSQVASVGADVRFAVEAEGADPLAYQWFFHGTELPDATSSTLILRNVAPEHAGEYQVAVSNSAGFILSTPAILTVQAAATMLQISCARPAIVQLSWPATPDQSYSVLAGDAVTHNYLIVATGLFFPDGAGIFKEGWSQAEARFYRVCSP